MREYMEYVHNIESPLGTLAMASDGENISGLWIEGQKYFKKTLEKDTLEQKLPVFESVRKWLDIYFSGREPDFLPPLMPKGSQFQKMIWDELVKIPYGKTISYGELAEQYKFENEGKHTSARAVGGVVGRNPISILIPCHRVIGKNGSLTGYAGGICKKQQLLRLEGVKLP
ncbi:MAG: methylated-DNA--[protein]-cysteine S-methyltransferase [Spirochaetaceae bacterium]|nr:methylated-DNA--[protein]-cysteine S-methyltransferase [Spirochaetaceae bacterium]